MTARKALRELKQHTEALSPPPVIPPRPTWAESDRALAIHWKKYLKWEESNPLDIEDAGSLQSRVIYAMRKCLTQMRFFPELWWVLQLACADHAYQILTRLYPAALRFAGSMSPRIYRVRAVLMKLART